MTLHHLPAPPAATELALADWSARSFDVRPRHPVIVACVTGALLVTVEGDPDDHVLAPGEALTASRRGRVVVAALGPATVRLQRAAR
jgi:hypothetical protein